MFLSTFFHRIKALCFVLLILTGFSQALSQEAGWDWAKNSGGRTFDECVTVHRYNGNTIFAGGVYTGIAQFGPYILNCNGQEDGLIMRYTGFGDIVWALKIGGTGNDKVNSMFADPDGNVYVTGYFENIAALNSAKITSNGGKDIFLAKYTALGDLVWARNYGGQGNEQGTSVTCDRDGNVYLTGIYSDSIKFGNLNKLTAYGGTDMFVLKINKEGVEVTARKSGGVQNDNSTGLITDTTGLYMVGTFNGTATFGNFATTSYGGSDIFLVKYALENLEEQWLKKIGSSGNDFSDEITNDTNRYIMFNGTVSGAVSADTITTTAYGATDGFVAKYNEFGDIIYAKSFGSAENDECTGISSDFDGNTIVAANIRNTAIIDTFSISSQGERDIAVFLMDSLSKVKWVQKAGSSSDEYVHSIANNFDKGGFIGGATAYQASFSKTLLTGRGGFDVMAAHILNIRGNDAGITSIIMPTVPYNSGFQSVKAIVKNFGKFRIDSIKIDWRINGTAMPVKNINTMIMPGQSLTVVLGNISFPAATLTNIQVTSILPNGQGDENPANDVEILRTGPGLLKGTYTVGGSSPQFNTLAIACSYINNWGILDSVTFSVRSGSYVAQISMGEIPGASPSKPIVIIKDSKAITPPSVSFESLYPENNYVMNLNGTDGIRFNSIDFTSLGSVYGNVFVLNKHTKRISIENSSIEVSAALTSKNIYSSEDNKADSLSIQNCKIKGGGYAVYMPYDTAANASNTLSIINNNISSVKATAIHIANTIAPIIHNNIINANNENINGINILKSSGSGKITNNYISQIKAGTGIWTASIIGDTANPYLFANNLVKAGIPSTSATGMYVKNAINTRIYHNTLHSQSSIPGKAALETMGGNKLDIQNNIFYNSGGGYAVLYAYDTISGRPQMISDYNNLYSSGTTLAVLTDGVNDFFPPDLPFWKAAPISLDSHSVSKLVAFKSDLMKLELTDELLYGNSAIRTVVPKDIDTQNRTRSYMGADEIIPIITIVQQPQRVSTCLGNNAVFKVNATITNGANLTYQWTKNNVSIKDSTRSELSLKNIKILDEGFYRCILSGNSGADTIQTNICQLIVATKTIILNEPQTQFVQQGGTAILEVGAEAGGIPPSNQVLYRWFKDTTEFIINSGNISGANSPRLTIKNISPADTGIRYRVIVEGACGIDTSETVGIFMPGVLFSSQPKDTSVCLGEPVQVSAKVFPTIAGLQLAYQWKKNNITLVDNKIITGARTPNLSIKNLTPADTSSEYVLEVTVFESKARFFSDIIKILLNKPTAVLVGPKSKNACPNKPHTLFCTAEGAKLQYQWQRNDTNILGAVDSAYTITKMDPRYDGRYRVVVTGVCGTSASETAIIKSLPALEILVQPLSLFTTNFGRTIVLSLNAAGATPFTFEWFHNGVKDPLNEDKIFSRSNSTIADTGLYWCRVSNACDTIYSDTTRVKLFPTSIDEHNDMSATGTLSFNTIIPNPTEQEASANFSIAQSGIVKISISDMMGRIVLLPFNSFVEAGYHSIPLNINSLPNGMYQCSIYIQGITQSKFIILQK